MRSSPLTCGSWMSVITRSGEKLRAASSALRLSVTASGSWPCAASRSQNSLMLRALSSTIRILAKLLPSPVRGVLSRAATKRQTTRVALALAALAATLGDERRAQRFLDLTGIGTDELRAQGGRAGLLAALLRFLEAHEPDLVAVAEAAWR